MKEFLCTLVIFLSLSTSIRAFAQTVINFDYDNFNDNKIDVARWVDVITGAGPIVAETNGQLEIEVTGDSVDHPRLNIIDSGYISSCRLKGDFDIQVSYNLLNWPYSNGVRVGIAITSQDFTWGASVTRVSFGNSLDSPAQPREVYLTDFDDGTKGIMQTTEQQGELRLVRTGNTLTVFIKMLRENGN